MCHFNGCLDHELGHADHIFTSIDTVVISAAHAGSYCLLLCCTSGARHPRKPTFQLRCFSAESCKRINNPPLMTGLFVCGSLARMHTPWIWKGISVTWQSGRYTLLYPRGRTGHCSDKHRVFLTSDCQVLACRCRTVLAFTTMPPRSPGILFQLRLLFAAGQLSAKPDNLRSAGDSESL